MIISVTGSRPSRLGGYKIPNTTYNRVKEKIKRFLIETKPRKVYSGMALGVDLWIAEVCIELAIPFVAVIPYVGQDSEWHPEARSHYRYLLSKASETIVVTDGGYATWKLLARNRYLVDILTDSDILVAVHDGISRGTQGTIDYATQNKKKVVKIDPFND